MADARIRVLLAPEFMGRGCRHTAAVVLACSLAWSSAASAQMAPPAGASGPAAPAPAAPPSSPGGEYSGPPNRPMLGIGITALLLGYIAAAAVGSSSNATDGSMLAPVAGPWVNLGNRPGCGGPGNATCGKETWNRALVITDGVVQAWGLIAAGMSFFLKESQYPKLQVTPAAVGPGGYGLTAFGSF